MDVISNNSKKIEKNIYNNKMFTIMFKYIIVIAYILIVNSFISHIKTKHELILNGIRRTNLRYEPYKPKLESYVDDNQKEMYTIISQNNIKTIKLIEDLKKHKINHVYIDMQFFTIKEIDEIFEYYTDKKIMSYDNPLIFYENTTYLGGLYEMYEIISRY
jgi:hypothetical protein